MAFQPCNIAMLGSDYSEQFDLRTTDIRGNGVVDYLQGILAAAGVAFGGLLAIFKFFELHEKVLRKDKLKAISDGIVSFKFSSGARKVIALWVHVNNRVFGQKLISWRAAGVSMLLTNLWAATFIAVFCLLYPQFREWFLNIVELNSLRWYALGIYVAVLIIDFLSISLSRKIYRAVLSKGKRIFAWGLVLDILGSVGLYYLGLSAAKLLMNRSAVMSLTESLQVWIVPSHLTTLMQVVKDFDFSAVKPIGDGRFVMDPPLETEIVYAFPEGIFFFTSILTSIWLWGYLLAYAIAYVSVRLDKLSPRLWSVTKVEEQPLSVLSAILGYVWIFIVLLLSLLSFAFG